jgi:hypothetical protein
MEQGFGFQQVRPEPEDFGDVWPNTPGVDMVLSGR